MTAENLLDLNVNKLFEQHSIAEIDEIHKRLEIEVEKKREDLRFMVGERYRDLLKAADTITNMNGTTTTIVKRIRNLKQNCKILNEKQLIGFKIEPQSNFVVNKHQNTYFSIVIQIKILTGMPERIWTELDKGHFSIATELYILARHISTGLELDVNNEIMQYFPISKKHWELLKPFFFTIKEKCHTVLEQESLSATTAADCLLSLYLLEKPTLNKLYSNFFELRTKAYKNSLSSSTDQQKRVKDRIAKSLSILNSTIEIAHICFFEASADSGNKGLLYFKLEELSDSARPPSIFLLNKENLEFQNILPDIIRNFRPSFEVNSLSSETIKSVSEMWLKSISEIASQNLKTLIDLLASMKIIQDIKRESVMLSKPSNWNKICENLYLPLRLDFHQKEYQPLIHDRIQEVILQSWVKCTETITNEIKDLLEKIANPNCKNNEYKIWEEANEDIPSSLKNALSQDKRSNLPLMKIKGYNKDIISICSSLDKSLKIIFEDIQIYLDDKEGKFEEKQNLVEYLKITSKNKILELIENIKSFNIERNTWIYINLARLFTAFTEICPNLKTCLSYTYTSNNWDKLPIIDKKSLEKWETVCNALDNESFSFWKEFCAIFLEEHSLSDTLPKELTYNIMLKDFVDWDTIAIEESDEQDNPVQSTIKIPSQPRISVQKYFHKIIQSLNRNIPQTLPRKVLFYLMSKLVDLLLKYYENITSKDIVSKNQNMALQLYFDLRFIQLIFVSRDDKKAIDNFQKIISKLKSFTDPFDFELFYPYLNDNIKKCSVRMEYELGVLLQYPENIESTKELLKQSTIGAGFSLERDPNVLCLSSNGSSSTWFPLLPIVTTETKKKNSVPVENNSKTSSPKLKRVEGKMSTPNQNSSSSYTSNVKSGAAAFFGAMSQDWFR